MCPYILCLAFAYASALSSKVLTRDEPASEVESSGTTDPGREELLADPVELGCWDRCMILILGAGAGASSRGARSDSRSDRLMVSKWHYIQWTMRKQDSPSRVITTDNTNDHGHFRDVNRFQAIPFRQFINQHPLKRTRNMCPNHERSRHGCQC